MLSKKGKRIPSLREGKIYRISAVALGLSRKSKRSFPYILKKPERNKGGRPFLPKFRSSVNLKGSTV